MNTQLIMFAGIDLGALLFLVCGLLLFLFWLAMLIDCVKRETNDRIGWILVLVFLGVIGAPLYFFARKLTRRTARRLQPTSPIYQPWNKDQEIS
jgi:Na+/melibiose symporter-like transporter